MEKTYRALPDRKKKKFVDIWTKKKLKENSLLNQLFRNIKTPNYVPQI